ncbi:hypothetical protein MTO96_001651 [Rhipicephalus appendiculatus]
MSCTCGVHKAPPEALDHFVLWKWLILSAGSLDKERARRHADIYTKREVRSAREEVTPDVPGLITAADAFKLPETRTGVRLNGSSRLLGAPRLWSFNLGSTTCRANIDVDLMWRRLGL